MIQKNKNINWILFVSWATLISGFLSYLYHPLMIRYLSIEEFGIFASLLSLLNIFLVLIIALGLFYTKEVAKYISDLGYSKWYRDTSIKIIRYVSLSIFWALFVLSPLLWIYLDIPFYYVLPLWLTIIYSFYAVINNAFFQNLWKFSFIAFVISSSAILKILIWFTCVVLGFNVFWALWWVILSQIAMFYIGNIFLNKFFKRIDSKESSRKKVLSSFLSQKKQILQYIATSILIALFMNIDILIVKNMFDGETAGYYAAISVLAKFLVFLGLSIETVYYPQLVKESVFPKIQILKVSAYYLVITLWALIFFYLFWETILRLFKDGLQDYLWLIYPLLIYCGLLGYLGIIVKTLIAFERYTINYILTVLIVGLVVCLYSMWSTPLLVTQIFAVFWLLGLGLGVSQLIRR